MRHLQVLVLSEDDMFEDFKDKAITEVRRTDFKILFPSSPHHKEDMVIFTNSKGQTKILKDREGDAGKAVTGLTVLEIKERFDQFAEFKGAGGSVFSEWLQSLQYKFGV